VKRLNAIGARFAGLDWTNAGLSHQRLKRRQLIAMNSMILHEHYFAALGGEAAGKGALAKAIIQTSAASIAGARIHRDGQGRGAARVG
jgi:Fe-Mn family superoxide dismutase